MRLLLLLLFLTTLSNASTQGYPPGEKPPISMKQAYEFFDVRGKEWSGVQFNPHSADLSTAGWRFHQSEKNKSRYEFIYYFKDDLCLVISYSPEGKVTTKGFTKEGKKVPILDNRVNFPEAKDPFKN